MSKPSLKSPVFTFEALQGTRERATPIVLVAGDGLGFDCWVPYSSILSGLGCHGIILQLPDNPTSLDEMADYIHNSITTAKLVPPLMITASLSTLVAQKYLESYPLRGLMMVCPIPPTHFSNSLNRLLKKYDKAGGSSLSKQIDGSQFTTQERDTAILRNVYNISTNYTSSSNNSEQSKKNTTTTSSSTSLKEFLTCLVSADLEGSSERVHLEPGVVPMQVVTTRGDDVCSEEDLLQLLLFHGLGEEDVTVLDDPSRAPFLTTTPAFHEAIFPWIDDLA